MLLRILVITFIIALVVLGARRIWRDWSGQFRKLDQEDDARRRARDLAERKRPDVIELKRDKDGTYRPGDE
jgi:hypothetical protein